MRWGRWKLEVRKGTHDVGANLPPGDGVHCDHDGCLVGSRSLEWGNEVYREEMTRGAMSWLEHPVLPVGTCVQDLCATKLLQFRHWPASCFPTSCSRAHNDLKTQAFNSVAIRTHYLSDHQLQRDVPSQ